MWKEYELKDFVDSTTKDAGIEEVIWTQETIVPARYDYLIVLYVHILVPTHEIRVIDPKEDQTSARC